MPRRTLPLLALLALVAFGCKKDSTSTSSSSSSGASSNVASNDGAESVVDFPSTDANVWVNGAPVKLGEWRGDVVLVEAWHRQ